MKKYNIFWFIIDSVRTFKTGQDDRDRLDIIDELAEQSIEFNNCITSSPSSLLSAGAIFTGLPGVFIARHFNDWKFTGMEISSLATLKSEYNYNILPILDTRDLREILHRLLPPLQHNSLPKGYRLSDYVWHNIDITNIFKHYIDKEEPNKNHAYILWYDCRRDPKVNDHVKKAIETIRRKGYFDNSIIIMHSDHGYPDPKTKLDEKYFKSIGHDMMLTDDNIKVPLIIKYPNCPIGIKKEHQIGLIDVLPTIFDILEINYLKLNTTFQGQSLMPVIRGTEKDYRIRRTDTRLPMDVKRIGCLRNNKFKYIFLYNDEIEIFYDLKKDTAEMHNVIDFPEYEEIVNNFRKMNLQYEKELLLFHDDQVKENLSCAIATIKRKCATRSPTIVIVTKGIEILIEILVRKLNQNFNNPKIILVLAGGKNYSISGIDSMFYVENFNFISIKKLDIKNADLTIFLTENSSRVFLKKEQIDAVKLIASKTSLLMNYNFEIFNYFSSRWLNTSYIKLFFDWGTKGYFYKQDPLYFFCDIAIFMKYFIIKLIKSSSKRKTDLDLKAAREAIYFRKAILETNKSDLYNNMDDLELTNEIERLNTREF